MRPLPLLVSLMIPLGTGLATAPPVEAQLLNLLLGDSNYYGRVTTPWWGRRDWPQDALLYRRPVIASRRNAGRAPLYLRVPENQARNWGRYCRRYDACDTPAYFLRDTWYRNAYAPRYRNSYWKLRREKGREWWEDIRDQRRDWRDDRREVRRERREDLREARREWWEDRRDWLRDNRRGRRRDD